MNHWVSQVLEYIAKLCHLNILRVRREFIDFNVSINLIEAHFVHMYVYRICRISYGPSSKCRY